jgi:hypothetical protein
VNASTADEKPRGMSEELDTAQRYRQRAEELRTIALDDKTRENRDALLRIAKDYEQMADTLEAIDKTNRAMRRPRDQA